MKFQRPDIRPFLLESIPSRFKSLSLPEFEDLIRYLFEMDGFEMLPAVPQGDLSRVVLARKDNLVHAILAFKKDPEDEVQEPEVQKAKAAGTFYNAGQVWMISTSTFSHDAKRAADESGIEIWDWDELYGALCQLFFEGKNHVEFLESNPVTYSGDEEAPPLKLKVKWQATEGVTPEWFNLGVTVSNTSERNIYIHLDLPALIDKNKNQAMAENWMEGDFVAGMIYAGASVRTNALFSVAKIGDRPPGGRVVLTCHERNEVPLTYHLHTRLQGEACFLVTYCYTRESAEYRMMILYRDEILNRTLKGRLFIRLYYFISPHLVSLAGKYQPIDRLVRYVVAIIVPWVRRRFFTPGVYSMSVRN